MRKLLLVMGDIAAGKSTFAGQLSRRYGTAVFQKDTIKAILSDDIGFTNREENLRLSRATVSLMGHILLQTAVSGSNLILESNFHESELQKLHAMADAMHYDVLTLVLRGDPEVLYARYMHRMQQEDRHPAHLTTTLHVKEDFLRYAARTKNEQAVGESLTVDASDFSYQTNPALLEKIDAFMAGSPAAGAECAKGE